MSRAVEDIPFEPTLTHFDIDAVLRQRLGSRRRWVPSLAVSALRRLICQDRLNELLASNCRKGGSSFASGVLADLGASYRVEGADHLPPPERSRVIWVSNHPLGGLDGMALIDMCRRYYGMEPWFLVNDLLMAIEQMRSVFLPVNKHGGQERSSAQALEDALAGDRPVIIFPAGLCSRKGAGGVIADLEWRKSFVNYARRHSRDLVPMHFKGRNSPLFYNAARWRQRLGLKFNIEMLLLPREMVRASASTYTVTVGEPIPWSSLRGGAEAKREAAEIRERIYNLALKQS